MPGFNPIEEDEFMRVVWDFGGRNVTEKEGGPWREQRIGFTHFLSESASIVLRWPLQLDIKRF